MEKRLMPELTTEQRIALESGQAVPCIVDATECVVVRKDVFDHMRHVAYDDSEWTGEEMIALAERAFNDADTAGRME
jgi:hypothetical protein